MVKIKFDKSKKLKFKRLSKLKKIVSGNNLIGFETAVIGAVIVYVVVLSGMIKINSLLTGLILVGAGAAMLFGDSVAQNKENHSEQNTDVKSKTKIESLGMLLLHQGCVLGMAAMLVLSRIYDNRTDYFGWILAVFAAIMLGSILVQRIVKKYKAR